MMAYDSKPAAGSLAVNYYPGEQPVPCQLCEQLRCDLRAAEAELKVLREFAAEVNQQKGTER